ncbi:MAG: BBE domain-containing protein [Planctomycetota bacterium]
MGFSASTAALDLSGGRPGARAGHLCRNSQRLRAVTGKYDPTDFFRVNQNLRP